MGLSYKEEGTTSNNIDLYNFKKLYDILDEMTEQTVAYLIACCISADNNLDNTDRKRNINILKNLSCTGHRKYLINSGIELLEREIEESDNKQD